MAALKVGDRSLTTDDRTKTMACQEIDSILQKCKAALQALYGGRFAGLVLYGSMARGDYGAESDIDLLVLLEGDVDTYSEIWPIVEALYPLQSESDQYISAHAMSLDDYQNCRWPFYLNVRREGVAL